MERRSLYLKAWFVASLLTLHAVAPVSAFAASPRQWFEGAKIIVKDSATAYQFVADQIDALRQHPVRMPHVSNEPGLRGVVSQAVQSFRHQVQSAVDQVQSAVESHEGDVPPFSTSILGASLGSLYARKSSSYRLWPVAPLALSGAALGSSTGEDGGDGPYRGRRRQ